MRNQNNPVEASQAIVLRPSVPGLPQRFPLRMRYRGSNTIACVSGSPGTWVIGANSLYDPDVTFTGHQPMNFDQLAGLYNNYCVYRAKATFTVIPIGSEAAPSLAVVYPSNTNTAASYTLDEAREQKGASEAYIAGDHRAVTVSKTVDIRELMGKSRDYVLDDTTYSSSVTSAPSDITYIIFEIGTLDGSTRTFYVDITVDFDCVFMQVKQQGSS